MGAPDEALPDGAWYTVADECRCANRLCYDAGFRYPSIGFRVAIS
ncbi:hypothetical protein [Kamptonema formosum]|nr:hypothetical protein [Oscillatoria sp. PCC 10802]